MTTKLKLLLLFSFLTLLILYHFRESSKFPSSNFLHSHCRLKGRFHKNCSEMKNELISRVKSFEKIGPKGGHYGIKEIGGNWVWGIHTTPSYFFTDDQMFRFIEGNTKGIEGNSMGNPKGNQDKCIIDSFSRSRFISYFDSYTNYCTLWNVLRGIGENRNEGMNKELDLQTSDCRFAPEDPWETCILKNFSES